MFDINEFMLHPDPNDLLRQQAIAGDYGANAILHETRKAKAEYDKFEGSTNTPNDIELIQALLRFAADQTDLNFLVPYLGKSEDEIKNIIGDCLVREVESLRLCNNSHEATISLCQYELARNTKHMAAIKTAITKNYPEWE